MASAGLAFSGRNVKENKRYILNQWGIGGFSRFLSDFIPYCIACNINTLRQIILLDTELSVNSHLP